MWFRTSGGILEREPRILINKDSQFPRECVPSPALDGVGAGAADMLWDVRVTSKAKCCSDDLEGLWVSAKIVSQI